MTLFESLSALGAKIESENVVSKLTADEFSHLAMDELSSYMATCSYGEQDFLDNIFALDALVPQMDRDGRFGTPPITVFDSELFVVDVYYWAHADTSIHSHAFCGAFAVLAGKTLHLVNQFEQQEELYPHISLGRLCCEKAEILSPGDSHAIIQGTAFLHAAIHLCDPTITLCIRSKSKLPGAAHQQGMQLSYIKPSLLYATVDLSGINNSLHAKQRQLLTNLMASESPTVAKIIAKFRKELGDELALLNLIVVFGYRLPNEDTFNDYLESFSLSKQQKKYLYSAFIDRKDYISWKNIRTDEQKLVAALLEAKVPLPDFIAILADFSENPSVDGTDICQIITELAENNALPLKLNETATNILMGICLGMADNELLEALAEQYQQQPNGKFAEEVAGCYKTLAAIPIFSGLQQA